MGPWSDQFRQFNIPCLQSGILVESCQGIITCLKQKRPEFTAALPMFAHGKCPKRGLVWMTPWLWDAKLLYFQVFNPKIPFQALADSHGKTMESILPASTTHHIVENIRILHRHPTAEDHTGNPRTLHAELHQPGKTSQREVRKVASDFWVKTGLSWTMQNQEFMLVPFRSMWYLY